MKKLLLILILCLAITSNSFAVITSGNYTLKASGGDYDSWNGFWTDVGNLTGDLTLTIDASDFTAQTAPVNVEKNLNGYTLTVQGASYPTTTDGTTGARITLNANAPALYFYADNNGTIIIQGLVINCSGTANAFRFGGSLTYIVRRNIITSNNYGIYQDSNTQIGKVYNNIFKGGTRNIVLDSSTGAGAFCSNNTIIVGSLAGIYQSVNGGLYENNLAYGAIGANYSFGASTATGNNNSSYDDTADDFTSGANNRINKTTSPFTNYAGDDFTLAAGSDPIGNGKDLSASFTTDFFGNTRATWDIGACAYVSPTNLKTVNGLAYASIGKVDGVAIGSVGKVDGLQ